MRSAAQPRELLAGHVAPAFFLYLSSAVPLNALKDVGRVASLERVDRSIVDFPHRGADLVEEPTVVRDHEQRARARLPAGFQMMGEPVDGAHIEMVGGLIEHENVVGADEQARKIDAPALAARERADRTLPRDVGNKPGKDFSHARRRGPLVLGCAPHHRVTHGIGVIEVVALAKKPYGKVPPVRYTPIVGFKHSGKQIDERRLAIAVAANDADAIALVNTEGDVFKDAFRGKVQRYAVAAQKDCHVVPFESAGEEAQAIAESTASWAGRVWCIRLPILADWRGGRRVESGVPRARSAPFGYNRCVCAVGGTGEQA